jgi:8-oxo-dGTP pyrophosphatase MutT (NUDIX family)
MSLRSQPSGNAISNTSKEASESIPRPSRFQAVLAVGKEPLQPTGPKRGNDDALKDAKRVRLPVSVLNYVLAPGMTEGPLYELADVNERVETRTELVGMPWYDKLEQFYSMEKVMMAIFEGTRSSSARAPGIAQSWLLPLPSYKPVWYVSPDVLANENEYQGGSRAGTKRGVGWADTYDWQKTAQVVDTSTGDLVEFSMRAEIEKRVSAHGPLVFFDDGRPCNPMGRTGRCGRGDLGLWGVNNAANPLVYRLHPEDRTTLQVALIQRRDDSNAIAVPGGMLEGGLEVSATLFKEFREEAAANMTEGDELMAALRSVFEHQGVEVYRGFVTDPRTSDDAWIETVAKSFFLPPSIGDKFELQAGDDATRALWVDVKHVSNAAGNRGSYFLPDAKPSFLRGKYVYASHIGYITEGANVATVSSDPYLRK